MVTTTDFLANLRARCAHQENWRQELKQALATAESPSDIHSILVKKTSELGFQYVCYSNKPLTQSWRQRDVHICNFDPTGQYPGMIARRLARHWDFRLNGQYIHGWTKTAQSESSHIGILSIAKHEPISEQEIFELNELFDWLAVYIHQVMTAKLSPESHKLVPAA